MTVMTRQKSEEIKLSYRCGLAVYRSGAVLCVCLVRSREEGARADLNWMLSGRNQERAERCDWLRASYVTDEGEQ